MRKVAHEESSQLVLGLWLPEGPEVAAPPLPSLDQSCLAELAFRRNPRRVEASALQHEKWSQLGGRGA